MNLIKESIQKRLLTEQKFVEIGVLKNIALFRRKHLFWSVFHKTLPEATSEKSLNFPGKHRRRRLDRFIFYD